MNHVFVDFEMHPVDKEHKEIRRICQREIIEFGAVMVDDQGNELSDFKSYVKPEYCVKIKARYRELTGIDTSMVQGASGFARVLEKFTDWCYSLGDEVDIYAWSENDLRQLKEELLQKNLTASPKTQALLDTWKDFQQEYCHLIRLEHALNLGTALEILGEDFSGQVHDALWDARNTAALYRLSRDEEEFERRRKTLCIFNEPNPISVSLGDLFDFSKLNLK